MLWHLHDDVHPGFLQKLVIELLCITVEHHVLISLIFTPLQDVLLLFRNDTSLPQFVAIIRSSASEIGNHTAFEHFYILLFQFVEHFFQTVCHLDKMYLHEVFALAIFVCIRKNGITIRLVCILVDDR